MGNKMEGRRRMEFEIVMSMKLSLSLSASLGSFWKEISSNTTQRASFQFKNSIEMRTRLFYCSSFERERAHFRNRMSRCRPLSRENSLFYYCHSNVPRTYPYFLNDKILIFQYLLFL